ncbi:MAG: hypothetical protein HN348_23930, partial [Proteobacteria bacterium]|nr:hypothetical protein [Pseudomonadota bacterium]
DIFAQWCDPCQDNAPHGQSLWEDGGGEVIVLALMQESTSGKATEQACAKWASDYGLTHPILADKNKSQNHWAPGGYPTYVVLDREMKVIKEDLWPFDSDWVLDQL